MASYQPIVPHGQPISWHAEIARAIMERKGLPVGDAVAVKRVAGMVKGAMRRRAGRMAAMY